MRKLLSVILTSAMAFSLIGAIPASAEYASDEIKSSDTWTVTATSENTVGCSAKVLDDNLKTYWHTNYKAEGSTIVSKDECPHDLVVMFDKAINIGGIRYYPRQDSSASGSATKVTISGSKDGKTFTQIKSDEYSYGSGNTDRSAKTTLFSAVGSYKAIKLTVDSSIGGYGTCAELRFLSTNDGSGTPVTGTTEQKPAEQKPAEQKPAQPASGDVYTDTSAWTIEASSQLSGSAVKAFDGKTDTYWHSNYTAADGKVVSHDENPFTITATFPTALEISGVRYIPRQKTEKDPSTSGIWQKAEIYGSKDGKSFTKLADAKYDVEGSRVATDTAIAKAAYKAIRIVVTESVNKYSTAAEIQFLTGKSSEQKPAEQKPVEQKPTEQKPAESASGDVYTDSSAWTIEASSQLSGSAVKAFDGKTDTYWHSNYTAADGKVVSHDENPFTITATFPTALEISGVRYIPRQKTEKDPSTSGIWQKAEIYGSKDGKSFTKLADSKYDVEGSRVATDTAIAKAAYKAIRIVVTESVNKYSTAAEIQFLTGKAAEQTAKPVKKVIKLQINSKNAMIGDESSILNAAPVISEGRTLVPIRFIGESLGAEVGWDADTKTVTVALSGKTIKLVIGSKIATIDGKETQLDVPAEILIGSTMVPIRFISENFGAEVEWNGDTKTVMITK